MWCGSVINVYWLKCNHNNKNNKYLDTIVHIHVAKSVSYTTKEYSYQINFENNITCTQSYEKNIAEALHNYI